MSKVITLRIPDDVERVAQSVATRTGRSFEDVVADLLEFSSENVPVHLLSDDEVLMRCDLQMPQAQQDQLWELLSASRERQLAHHERVQLDELMQVYRTGLLRKSEALKVAVLRGLRPPLA